MTGFVIKTVVFVLLFIIAFLMYGCEEENNPVAQYGDALTGAHERSKIAGQQITLKSIRNAIQLYYASNSSYPGSLDDIQQLMDEPLDPELYDYNPENGMVTLSGQ